VVRRERGDSARRLRNVGRMQGYGKVCALLAGIAVITSCSRNGDGGANAGDTAALSPDVFSHTDPATIVDQPCLGNTGVLITANAIGPVRVGTPLSTLRHRCQIALVKVPSSVAIQGPVFGVSVTGGLIIFTVAGKDSVIETIGTSSPAFRTSNGIGVGTLSRGLSFSRGRVCFQRDSVQVTRVLISRRALSC